MFDHLGQYTERRDASLEKLLKDSQSQVRELLPLKEDNIRLTTELRILQDVAATKDDEIKKLQKLLLQERSDRQSSVRKMSEDHNVSLQHLELHTRKVEDELSHLKTDNYNMTRELERKSKTIQHLESELAALHGTKSEERSKAAEKQTLAMNVELERNRAIQQCEEMSRANVKLEQSRKALETQLSSIRQELDQIKLTCEDAKRQKSDTQIQNTQLQAHIDVSRRRMEALEAEMVQMAALRVAIAQLEPVREEAARLQSSLESAESAMMQERHNRKTVEAERDQLLLRVRSLESDVRRLESDCHRAQTEAAERTALRRENMDMKQTLDQASQQTAVLQKDLANERSKRTEEKNYREYLSAALQRGIQALGSALNTKTDPTPSLSNGVPHMNTTSLSLGQSQTDDDVEDPTGLLRDRPINSSVGGASVRTPLASPIYRQTHTDSTVDSRLSNRRRDVTGDPPAEPSSKRDAEQVAESMLNTLRTATSSALRDLSEESARRIVLAKQLEAEQRRNSELEDQHRRLHQELTQKHLEHVSLSDKEQQLTRLLRQREEDVQRLMLRLRHQESLLHNALDGAFVADDNGSFTSSSKGVENILNGSTEGFDGILHSVRSLTSQLDVEKRLRKNIEIELEQHRHMHAECLKAHNQQLTDIESKNKQQFIEQRATLEQHVTESTRLQEDLRLAVQVSVQRYEHALQELDTARDELRRTTQRLSETENQLSACRQEAERRRLEVLSLNETVSKERDVREDLERSVAGYEQNLQEEAAKHKSTAFVSKELDSRCEILLQIVLSLGRYVLALDEGLVVLCNERRWAMQYALSLEKGIKLLIAECPPSQRDSDPPMSSSRRDAAFPRMVRFTSLRPVVIAVIAAQRIQKLYFAVKSEVKDVDKPCVVWGPFNPISNGTMKRRLKLPSLNVMSAKVLAACVSSTTVDDHPDSNDADSPSRLRSAVRQLRWDLTSVLQSVVSLLSANAVSSAPHRMSFSMLWSLASGLAATRNSLHVGVVGQAKRAALNLRHDLRSSAQKQELLEQTIQRLEKENTTLVEMIHVKSQQLDKSSEDVQHLRNAMFDMIDRRQFQAVEQSLSQAIETLEQEKLRSAQTEQRLSFLKKSEAQMLLRQSELQNEARSLAIELAKKSAQIVTMDPERANRASLLMQRSGGPPPPIIPIITERSISPPWKPQRQIPATVHPVSAMTHSVVPQPNHESNATQQSQRLGNDAHRYPSPNAIPASLLRPGSGILPQDVMSMIHLIDEKITRALNLT